jgi:hypothetical protein
MRDIKTGRILKNSDRDIINDFSGDDPATAYWAGFLYGDGCIQKGGQLQVCLSSVDLAHLIKLSLFICGNDYVCKYDTRCYFQISHEDIRNGLAKWGILHDKTKTGTLDNIKTEYMKDFIRGYFDADGWVSIGYYKNGKYNMYYRKFCVGICSYNIANLEYINQLVPTPGKIKSKKSQVLYELVWSSIKKDISVIKFLYDSELSLSRKAVKLCQLINYDQMDVKLTQKDILK